MWHARTVIMPFVKKYGVSATFKRKVVYVYLDENQAFSEIFCLFSRLLYHGKLTAKKNDMDWLKGHTL